MKEFRNKASIIGLVGVILMIFAENYLSECKWVARLLYPLGQALIVLAIVQWLFKQHLHTDLIEKVKQHLQTELIDKIIINLKSEQVMPLEMVYLRRKDMPPEEQPTAWIEEAENRVIMKGISFSIIFVKGFTKDLKRMLKENPKLKLDFLLYDAFNSTCLDLVSKVANVKEKGLKDDITKCIEIFEDLNKEFPNRIRHNLYTAFPTSGFVVVDPELSSGKMKIETYIYEGQEPDRKMNLFLLKKQDEEYFSEIYESLDKELSLVLNNEI